jgi:Outer membrane protein beta-barrel domain
MKHYIKATIWLLTTVFTLHGSLFAGGPEPPVDNILTPGVQLLLFGPYAGLNINMHSGKFATAQGDIICCEFDGGNGFGPVGGVKAFIPLADKLYLSPRLGYENLSGTFDAEPQMYPFLGAGNTMELTTFQNELEATMHGVSFDLHAAYVLTSFGLYVTAGPSVSYLISADYTLTEKITNPPGVRYLDGGTEKQVYAGDLEITESAFFAVRGGLGALIELNNKLYLNPELLYGFALTPISKTDDWKANMLQVSIAVLFVI